MTFRLLCLWLGVTLALVGSCADAIPPANLPVPKGIATSAFKLDDDHKLTAGDKISFKILEDRDEARILTVADSGELDVPYIGRMKVAGFSCQKLADAVRPVLEKDYYYRATVVIGVEFMAKTKRAVGEVVVVGQVRKEGPVEMPVGEKFTVSKAVLAAGGFAEYADRKKVKVFREGAGKGGERAAIEVDMVEVLEKGRSAQDQILQPGDLIVVSKRLINF